MRRRPGFTLIELLVVVTVIALLVSMLLPSLHLARDRAKTISCLGGLKQVGLGLMLYASDTDDYAPATVRGRGNRFTTDKTQIDYNPTRYICQDELWNGGGTYFDVSSCTELGGGTLINTLTDSGDQPANYADTLIASGYAERELFSCAVARQSDGYETGNILSYAPLMTLVSYDWSNGYWGELSGMKINPVSQPQYARLRRNGVCDPWRMTAIRVPDEGCWLMDTSNSGHILVFPFEFIDAGSAIYNLHNSAEAANQLYYDGHVRTRSKRETPSMFRLRLVAGGGDVVGSPYVNDSGQTDPDGLWRAWLLNYPHSGNYQNNQ